MNRRERREEQRRLQRAHTEGGALEAPLLAQPASSPAPHTTFGLLAEFHGGPLPSPDTLRGYEATLPGSANRIVEMAERQAAHRQRIETDVVNSNIAREKWGQIIGAILFVLTLGTGTVLTAMGFSIGGLGAIITAGVSAAGVFIAGKVKRGQDLQQKRPSQKQR